MSRAVTGLFFANPYARPPRPRRSPPNPTKFRVVHRKLRRRTPGSSPNLPIRPPTRERAPRTDGSRHLRTASHDRPSPLCRPPRLTPPGLKQTLLESEGADYLVILPPEKKVLDLTAEDFWTILKDQVAVSDLVEGASFRFGRGRRGSVELLQQWSQNTNVKLHIVPSLQLPLLDLQITPVSSSVIRFLLAFGRAAKPAFVSAAPIASPAPSSPDTPAGDPSASLPPTSSVTTNLSPPTASTPGERLWPEKISLSPSASAPCLPSAKIPVKSKPTSSASPATSTAKPSP